MSSPAISKKGAGLPSHLEQQIGNWSFVGEIEYCGLLIWGRNGPAPMKDREERVLWHFAKSKAPPSQILWLLKQYLLWSTYETLHIYLKGLLNYMSGIYTQILHLKAQHIQNCPQGHIFQHNFLGTRFNWPFLRAGCPTAKPPQGYGSW